MPPANPLIRDIKKQLSTLKRARRFVPWGQSKYLARELEELLSDIREQVADPQSGATLIADFFTTDRSVFDRCDDSSGTVGDVYRYYATDLFCDYARRCDDKEWLAALVSKTISDDAYGVRDSLLDHAADYLDTTTCRNLIARFTRQAEEHTDEYRSRSHYTLAATLARQIKDPQLFEQIELASWGKEPSLRVWLDIARVYLESGQPQVACEKLLGHQEKDSHWRHDRDRLLLDICRKTGDKKLETETAWRLFRFQRDVAGFTTLIKLIGEDQKDRLLMEEIDLIQQQTTLNLTDLRFLIQMKQWEATESYIFNRADQLNGDHYHALPNLAADLETVGRSLSATLIYRALLDSILARAQTKTYGHGARYLKKLDLLSDVISDWRGFQPHKDYFDGLKAKHGRKTSFWGRYE